VLCDKERFGDEFRLLEHGCLAVILQFAAAVWTGIRRMLDRVVDLFGREAGTGMLRMPELCALLPLATSFCFGFRRFGNIGGWGFGAGLSH